MNNLKCSKLIPVSVRLFFIGLAIAGFTGEASAQRAFCTEGSVIDCAGECDGKKIFDECQVCDGSGKTNYNTAQAGPTSTYESHRSPRSIAKFNRNCDSQLDVGMGSEIGRIKPRRWGVV